MKRCKKTVVFVLMLLSLVLCACAKETVDRSDVNSAAQQNEETVALAQTTEQADAAQTTEEQPTTEEMTVEESIPEEPASPDIIPESFAYSVVISINPLVELYFDAKDTVVGVAYLNEDALDAYQKLELIGESYEASMNLLIQTASDEGYLKEDGTVEVTLEKVGDESREYDEQFVLNLTEIAEELLSDKEIKAETVVAVAGEAEQKTGVKTPQLCSACNGTGNDCKECSGTGIVNCKRCDNGIESCGTCHGSAKITCHGCHGSKTVGNGETCNYCGGSGIMSCDACGGQGKFSCSWCGGALRHVCPDCWGEGVCAACGGDGYL